MNSRKDFSIGLGDLTPQISVSRSKNVTNFSVSTQDKRSRIALKVFFPELNGGSELIEFDKIGPLSKNVSVSVTEFTLVAGDPISEHVMRKPETYSLTGSFSLTGKFSNSFVSKDVMEQTNNRLSDIRSLLEKVAKNGYRVDILSLHDKNEECVITDIQWTETVSTLDFTMSLKRVFKADLSLLEYELEDSEDLPLTDSIAQVSVFDTLLNDEYVWKMVLEKLFELELIDEGLYAQQIAVVTGGIMATLSVVGFGVLAAGIIVGASSAAGVAALVPVIGWIVAGVIVIGTAVALFFTWLMGQIKRRKLLFKNNEEGLRDLLSFKDSLLAEVKTLSSMISVYSFTTNKEQTFEMQLSGETVFFTLTFNQSSQKWIIYADKLGLTSERDVVIKQQELPTFTSIFDVAYDRGIENTLDSCYIYPIMSANVIETIDSLVDRLWTYQYGLQDLRFTTKEDLKKYLLEQFNGQTEIVLDNELRNYYLVISSRPLSTFFDALEAVIDEALRV